jgi:hypothetical protein
MAFFIYTLVKGLKMTKCLCCGSVVRSPKTKFCKYVCSNNYHSRLYKERLKSVLI